MDIIEKLTEIFKEFPGIGERQAKRFVYFLMHKNPAYAENLCSLILELKKEVADLKKYRSFRKERLFCILGITCFIISTIIIDVHNHL